MTAADLMLHRTLRSTARVNWHRIADRVIVACAVSVAVFAIMLGLIDLVTP